jgi:hypothetical protein
MTRRRDEMAQKDNKEDTTIKLSNTNKNTDEKFSSYFPMIITIEYFR